MKSRHMMTSTVVAAVLGSAAAVFGQSATKQVFVCNNVSDEISSFRFFDDGSVEFVGNYAVSDGPLALAVNPSGTHLAVTHGTQNDVFEYVTFLAVAPDGSLTNLGTDQVPNAPLGVAWVTDDVVAITKTEYGGDNRVNVYQVDFELATITQIDSEQTGQFCVYVIRSHDDSFLIANNSAGGNSLYKFDINPDGTLDLNDQQPTGVYPLDPALTHDDSKVYAGGGISGSGHDVIGYSIDGDAGFQILPGSPYDSQGSSPAYLAATSDDAYLVVGHGSDATVRTFTIEADGSLSPTGFMFDIGLQGTIGDIQPLLEYILITDESTAIDGIAGLYVFRVETAGTFTQVGPVHNVGGVRPEAIATWIPTAPACVGDLDGDGDTDQGDLGQLLAAYGEDGGGDLDGDGDTDQADLGVLLGDYGCEG